jgi:hypothetical protein
MHASKPGDSSTKGGFGPEITVRKRGNLQRLIAFVGPALSAEAGKVADTIAGSDPACRGGPAACPRRRRDHFFRDRRGVRTPGADYAVACGRHPGYTHVGTGWLEPARCRRRILVGPLDPGDRGSGFSRGISSAARRSGRSDHHGLDDLVFGQ